MSKQLEKEYRTLMNEDMPDLWGRIEAGLEPKQQPARKTGVWRKYRAWGAVAAACVCLMLAVPVGIRQMTGGASSAADNASPADGNMSGSPAGGSAAFDSVQENAEQNMSNEVQGDLADGTEAPVGEELSDSFTVTARVLEMSEAEGKIAYTVEVYTAQVEDTDYSELSNGEQITLYDGRMSGIRLEEGETYRLRVTVRTDSDGAAEYLLEEIDP